MSEISKTNHDMLEQFESIWNNVDSGIAIVDAETRQVLDFNPSAVRLFGAADKSELIGKYCHKFICPAEECCCPIMDKNQIVDRSERIFINAKGEQIPVIKTVTKIRYDGRMALLESFTDISHLKKADEQKHMLDLAERAQALLDASPHCVHFWDKNLNIIDCNLATVKLYKMSSKQEYLERYHELTPEFQPDGNRSNEKAAEYIGKAFDEGYNHIEWMRQMPDGEPVPLDITLVRVDYKGEPLVAAYSRDLREHKKIMRELQDANAGMLELGERIQIMLDSSPLSTTIVGKNLNIIDCNQEAIKMFGMASKEEYMKRFHEFVPKFQPDGQLSSEMTAEHILTAFEKGYHRCEYMHKLPNGELLPTEVTLVRVSYKGEDHIAGYTRDLREYKKMIEEIEQRDNLLNTGNIAANTLLAAEAENTKAAILESMELIGKSVGVDRVQIWKNEEIDGQLHFAHTYEWLSETGKQKPSVPIGLKFPYSAKPKWEKMFLRGESINAPFSNMSPEDQEFLTAYEMKAIVIIPLFLNEYFWGFFSVDDCKRERTFSNDEMKIMQGVSLMIASAVLKNDIIQDTRATAAKLNAVISNYAGVIWCVDMDETVTLYNGLYLEKIGVTPDFIEGKNLDVARQKGRHIDIIEKVRETISTGKSQDWISGIDGKQFRVRTTLMYDENNKPAGVVGSADEVTEMIGLQNSMRELGERVQLILDTNPHITIMFDSNFKLIDCNPAAIKFMGFETKDEMLAGFTERMAKSLPEYQSTGRQTFSVAERLMIAAKEGVVKFETEMIMDSEQRNIHVEFIKIPYENSFAIVGYIVDMTKVHEREMELAKAREQIEIQLAETEKHRENADAANKAKSAFLSTMSHEIRTPMNAILGITEIQLQNESLDEDMQEALGKIYTSGDMLLGIINDILDLSKIEAGKLELMPAKYEIASLISDTAQLNMMRIGSKPIEFELDIDPNMPLYVSGDELRVKQILNNLLSNAFKYTAAGTVTLSITTEPGKDNDKNSVVVAFSVTDTGQGMSKEQVAKLFDEYSRFNMEANRTTEGTGLGMSITRNLIRMMDGEIFIESEPGKGSTFTIHLPQGRIGSEVLGKEVADNLHQFRTRSRAQMRRTQIAREPMPYGSILIVDDVETNIYVAKGLMAPYGIKIDSANSGFAAIEKIKTGNIYDIVFMDHMMPKMDGVETTKHIREMKYEYPIVALTANAVAGQAEIFLGNGFDDFISKPIDVRQLNNVLNKLIRDKQKPEVIEAARQQAEAPKKQPVKDKSKTSIDSEFAKIFVMDAKKSLAVLEEIINKGIYDEDDMRTYVIHIHGMKSALANIGVMDLSAVALKLEMSGRDANTDVVISETPAFLDSLHMVIKELTPKELATNNGTADEDPAYLREKFLAVKAACEEYDEKAAEKIIAEVKSKIWSKATTEILDAISEHLFISEFDEIVSTVDIFLTLYQTKIH